MINLLKKFLDASTLKEIILAILFFISSIIFAINEDKMDKEYQKKYIVIQYLPYFVFFIFVGTNPETIDNSILTFLLITVLLNIICGINYGYKSGRLCKFLGRGGLALFKSLEWFFITKSYIFYIFIIALKIISYLLIRMNITAKMTYYFVLFVFFVYHILSNMVDTFGIYSFDDLNRCFFETKKSFGNLKPNENGKTDLVNILRFLVFVEDKDYFERKGAVFNPYYIIKRKMNNLRTSYINEEGKTEIRLAKIIRYYTSLVKHSMKLIFVTLKNIKTYIRGFSTIEQQLVRVLIMYPDTFEKYIFRRKIFVEWIASPMFFKAFRKRRKVIRGVKEIDYNQYKVEFLLFYYAKILNMPETIEDLIDKLYYNSRLNYGSLKSLLNKFNSSELKIKYTQILKEEFKKLKINI